MSVKGEHTSCREDVCRCYSCARKSQGCNKCEKCNGMSSRKENVGFIGMHDNCMWYVRER
jgi:hypothetical protein